MQCTIAKIASTATALLAVAVLAIGSTSASPARQGVVDTAALVGNFQTLVTALKAAGLVDILKGRGPFTVFAPTDEAFSRLPAGTVKNLLRPENKATLTATLTYPVMSGSDHAKRLTKLYEVKGLNGAMVKASNHGHKAVINDATVEQADVVASNDVIHVIDKALMRPGD